ncbi:MAG: hypothetical protein K2P90_00180, partial [Holosporales bacterium]|nr:hypothetical protein [Holosporales bacterium]
MRVAFTISAAVLPACVQPAFLISAEMKAMKDLGLTGWNSFAIFTAVLAPFLFVDSLINYTAAGWQVGDQLHAVWSEHLAPRLSRPRLHDQTPEIMEQATRKKFDADLDKLIHFLGQANDETIGQLYGDLQQIHEQMAQDSPDLPQDERQAREAAMVVFHLLSLGDQVKQSPSPKSSWYELTANTLNGACVIS